MTVDRVKLHHAVVTVTIVFVHATVDRVRERPGDEVILAIAKEERVVAAESGSHRFGRYLSDHFARVANDVAIIADHKVNARTGTQVVVSSTTDD